MRIKKYSSDLSPKSWQVIEKIIQVRRKSKWDLEEIVNAIRGFHYNRTKSSGFNLNN